MTILAQDERRRAAWRAVLFRRALPLAESVEEAQIATEVALSLAPEPEEEDLLEAGFGAAFAEGGWAPYEGARGGKGWKRGNEIRYQEKMPGSRGKAQEETPAEKPVPVKTPEPTEPATGKLPATPGKTAVEATKEPVEPPQLVDIDRAFNQMRDAWVKIRQSDSGVVKVPDLVDAMQADQPGLTTDEAHKLLNQWQKEDKLTLQLVNDPRLEPRAREMIQTDRGVRGYVELRKEYQTPSKPQPAHEKVAVPAGQLEKLTAQQAKEQSTTSPEGATYQGHDSIGRRICYQKGKRISCPATGKPASRAPTQKPEPTQAVQAINAAREAGWTSENVGAVSTMLGQMTVKELQAIRPHIPFKASRRKDEIKAAIKKAIGMPEEATATPTPQPEPAPTPAPVSPEVVRRIVPGRTIALSSGSFQDPLTMRGLNELERAYSKGTEEDRRNLQQHFNVQVNTDPDKGYEASRFVRELEDAVRDHYNGPITERISSSNAIATAVPQFAAMATSLAGAPTYRGAVQALQAEVDASGIKSRNWGKLDIWNIDNIKMELEREAVSPRTRDRKVKQAQLEKAKELSDKWEQLQANRKQMEGAADAARMSAVNKTLVARVKTPQPISATMYDGMSEELSRSFNAGLTAAQGIVEKLEYEMPTIPTYQDGSNTRAHYQRMSQAINWQGIQNPEVAIHELMHAVEAYDPGIAAACQDFYRHRVGAEEPQTLNDVAPGSSYGPYEAGIKDNFDRAFGERKAWYAGKAGGEEILTMGVQKLFEDPSGFAENDPEYCAFIVGVLDGSLRNKPIPQE